MLPALLLASTAFAHRPHAVVTALAARPDFERTGRAWIVYDPSDNAQLLRTDDHGGHWNQVGGAPQADALLDMAYLGATLVVLAEDGTVWATEDEGRTWASFELPEATPRAMATTETRIAIGTAAGVFAGEGFAPEDWTLALPASDVVEVAWSATGEPVLLARTEGGGVARSEDGGAGFAPLATVPGRLGATAIAEANGETWAGTDDGVVKLVDGAWTACAELPATGKSARSQWVTEMVADASGAIFAATADEAFFRSVNGCESWVSVETGLDATFGGIGGVSDPDQTYVGLVLGGRWGILAGFDGLAVSTDSGTSWTTVPIVASDWVRGMFVAPDFPADPRVYFGMYGGGVAWTADGGLTWAGSNAGLAGPFNFSLLPLPDFATSNTAWWAGGEPDPPAITRDGGETWTIVDVGFNRAMSLDAAGDRIYLMGAIDGIDGGQMVRSADGGETWELMTALHEALGGVYPGIVREVTIEGAPRLLIATDRPAGVIVSDDDGATWRTLSTWGAEERSTGLEVWGPSRILHAAYETGLYVSDDLGETWEHRDAPVAHPRFLAQADDGTLFTASGDGQVHRSRDGGDTWEAVGEPLGPTISLMQIPDAFAEQGVAFAGTTQGVFWTDDHGAAWHRLPRFQRYAAQGFHLTCSGACSEWDDGGGGLADAWELTEVDAVTFQFEGNAFRVDADLLGEALLVVEVDGAPTPASLDAEWHVSALPQGWHDVTLRVLGGPVRLHAIEVVGDGTPFPFDESPDTGDTAAPTDTADTADTAHADNPADLGRERAPPLRVRAETCGCGTEGPPGAVALLLAAALLRRYRRPGTWMTRSSSRR